MSDLRETVAGYVGGYHTKMKRWERVGGKKPSSEITSDRIIAAVAEALLSPEAVEAAAVALEGHPASEADKWLGQAALEAALTAIGAQPAKEGQ